VASEPVVRSLRERRRWLLIGPPVVLLIGKGLNTLVQLAISATPPDRIVLTIALAVTSIVAAFLLLGGGRVGWLLALIVIGWDLAVEIALWWVGQPDYVAMALLALCAFLVTTPDMRAAHVGAREVA
jgi:hypothetical protein